MKLFVGIFCGMILACSAPLSTHGVEPDGRMGDTNSVEDHFAAYGLGTVLQVIADPDRPDHGLTTIQMHQNIGKESGTNRFVAAIGPLTTARAFPYSDGIANNGSAHLPLSQWPLEPKQSYFVVIARRTNNYFLVSIDNGKQWEQQQGLQAYLASGQLPKDKEKAAELAEDLDRLRQEMSQTLAGLDPNISDEKYFAIMKPLETRERELSAKYQEVWSRMQTVPHTHPVFQPDVQEPASILE